MMTNFREFMTTRKKLDSKVYQLCAAVFFRYNSWCSKGMDRVLTGSSATLNFLSCNAK